MKKNILSAILLASISLTSCNDDDEASNVENENTYLPTKITGSNEVKKDVREYTYDSQNRLIKVIENSEEKSGQNVYNHKIIKTLEYQDSELVKLKSEKVSSYNGNQTTYTILYTVNRESNMIKLNLESVKDGETYYLGTETITINEKGYFIADENYTYSYDENGNIMNYFSNSGKSVMEYDKKNGTLKNINTPQWVLEYFIHPSFSYVNNAVKYTYENTNNPEDFSVITLNHQYNAAGYPIGSTASNGYNTAIEYTKK